MAKDRGHPIRLDEEYSGILRHFIRACHIGPVKHKSFDRVLEALACPSPATTGKLLSDKAGRRIGTLGISKDITPRIELEKRLRELSITDNLTGLFNQRHFREKLAQEASRARRSPCSTRWP